LLPFTKRPTALYESGSELVRTDEIEVLKSASRSSRTRSARPRPPLPSSSDEEMTRLMPMRPYRPAEPHPTFSSTRRPPAWQMNPAPPMAVDEPSRTLVRPPSVPPPSSQRTIGATFHAPKAPQVPREARLTQEVRATRPVESRPVEDRPPSPDSVPPVAFSTTLASGSPRGSSPSTPPPRPNMPGTIITARTRMKPGRPTAVWAAALVAMGVFVGLASAVLARGDADSLVDTTASFVDPARAAGAPGAGSQLAAQAAQPMGQAMAALAPSSPLTPGYVQPAAASPDKAKATATNDMPVADSRPDRLPPSAYAAPASRATYVPPSTHHAWKSVAAAKPVATPAAAPVADAPDAKEAAKDAAKSELTAKAFAGLNTPAPKATKSRRHGATEDDMESASAADALARAQLEAALR
jgi:hypothetical protein